MKRTIAILITILMSLGLMTGCGSTEKNQKEKKPDIEQIRNICNMATLECYYHNVAESTKTSGSGFTHIGEKDRQFWIEYTGVVRLGIDMTKVKMEMNGTTVKIKLPKAKVLGISIDKDSLNENSFILSEDGWNSNEITAEDQTNAIQNAQENMETTVKANESLLLSAQNRAKSLISNYIEQIGNLMGTHYETEWEYLNES